MSAHRGREVALHREMAIPRMGNKDHSPATNAVHLETCSAGS